MAQNKPMPKYNAALRIGVQKSLEYRFDFFVGILSTLFPILIQLFVWTAIYASGNTAYFGYDYTQMLVYVCVAGAVSKFVVTGIENLINDDIHSGLLAAFIVKPVSYIRMRLMQVTGEKLISVFVMAVFTAIVLTVLHFAAGFEIIWLCVLLFIPALLLATVLHFLIFLIISSLAFWFTEVSSFFHSIQVIVMVISGGVFPVAVLGKWAAQASQVLPFSYTMNFPITVLTGANSPEQMLSGFGVQIIWIAVLSVLAMALWRAGIKRFVAVGG